MNVHICKIFSLVCAAGISANALAAPIDDVLASMNPGEWYEVPNSRMDAHKPAIKPRGTETVAAVMDSWCGGAYDSKRDRLIVWGGGHNAYAGNEIYVFDINSLQWSRITDPTPNDQIVENGLHNLDGNPAARHTYNALQYAPNVDLFFSLGAGSTFGERGGSGDSVDAFDFDTLQWDTDRQGVPPTRRYSSYFGTISAYDPKTGTIWYHKGFTGDLAQYDPAADSWTTYRSTYIAFYATADIDPDRHIMVAAGHDQIFVWDLDNPGPPTIPPTSGDKTIEAAQAPGFQFDPVLKKFVGWNGGDAVYILDPDTWVWTKVNAAASNSTVPTAAERRGTYGRFRYVPSKNIYVVANRTKENVYILKLTDGTAPQWPSINMTASPGTVSTGGSTNISWTTSNATSCTASGAWSGSKAASSNGQAVTETVGPINATSTFKLTCSGSAGSVTSSLTVSVADSSSSSGSDSSGQSGQGDGNVAVATVSDASSNPDASSEDDSGNTDAAAGAIELAAVDSTDSQNNPDITGGIGAIGYYILPLLGLGFLMRLRRVA